MHLTVSLCPSKQIFQWGFCLCVCWWDHPAHLLCPTAKGLLRHGLRRPHGSCLRQRHPGVSVGGPLGHTFKEKKASLSLHCENTVTTSLLFFLKKKNCYTVTPVLLCSNLGHLYLLEYVCKMLLFFNLSYTFFKMNPLLI